ncbi:hypothetical protein TELCIR_09435 [Teladorsagia circumcincta]|uniref:Uncharacterized protein n=1 Tax=Teladorsagia circumcincta TaxID=45464 RepID=A0A2G9UF20_TELCI|nr:hypothetical protein TELCIR_09435 [Teladorsagia circumcincta]
MSRRADCGASPPFTVPLADVQERHTRARWNLNCIEDADPFAIDQALLCTFTRVLDYNELKTVDSNCSLSHCVHAEGDCLQACVEGYQWCVAAAVTPKDKDIHNSDILKEMHYCQTCYLFRRLKTPTTWPGGLPDGPMYLLDREKNSEQCPLAKEVLPASSGNASFESGGGSYESGGASNESGGASNESGGASNESGGASNDSGGASS